MAALAFIVVLVALILFLPVVVRLRVEWRSRPKFSIQISPLAGVLGLRMALPPEAISPSIFGKLLFSVPIPRRGRPPRKPKPSPRKLLEKFSPYLGPGFKYLREALRYLKLREVAADLRFGTGDPAKTGRLYGWLCALGPLVPKFKVRAHPLFTERSFSGRAEVCLWVLTYGLVWEGARLGVATFRIWRRELKRRRSHAPARTAHRGTYGKAQ